MVYADGLVSQLLLDGFYPTCIVSSGWLASAIGCSYQALSEIFSEFIEMKMIEKRHKKFRLLYDPDDTCGGQRSINCVTLTENRNSVVIG